MTKDSQHRDLFPGALEAMILQTLRTKPMDGYAIAQYRTALGNRVLATSKA